MPAEQLQTLNHFMTCTLPDVTLSDMQAHM